MLKTRITISKTKIKNTKTDLVPAVDKEEPILSLQSYFFNKWDLGYLSIRCVCSDV